MEEAQVSLSLVPGGAARRSPDRATGGVAVCETNSFPGGESPSSVPAADHTISESATTIRSRSTPVISLGRTRRKFDSWSRFLRAIRTDMDEESSIGAGGALSV